MPKQLHNIVNAPGPVAFKLFNVPFLRGWIESPILRNETEEEQPDNESADDFGAYIAGGPL
jgi:hypothetical protein